MVSSRESRVTGHVSHGSKSVTHCHLWSQNTTPGRERAFSGQTRRGVRFPVQLDRVPRSIVVARLGVAEVFVENSHRAFATSRTLRVDELQHVRRAADEAEVLLHALADVHRKQRPGPRRLSSTSRTNISGLGHGKAWPWP